MAQQSIAAGVSIRSLRKYAGMTLDDLARAADTSVAYLSKVETGTYVPTRAYVAKVTAAISREIESRAA